MKISMNSYLKLICNIFVIFTYFVEIWNPDAQKKIVLDLRSTFFLISTNKNLVGTSYYILKFFDSANIFLETFIQKKTHNNLKFHMSINSST